MIDGDRALAMLALQLSERQEEILTLRARLDAAHARIQEFESEAMAPGGDTEGG